MNTSVLLEKPVEQSLGLKPWAMPEAVRDSFRALRASLTASLSAGQVVAVASGSGGEGASWVCSRLACALVESGRPTAVVDAHRAHPSQAGAFGIAARASMPMPPQDFRKWHIGARLTIAESHAGMSLESMRSAISRLVLPGHVVLVDCAPFAAGAMAVELQPVLDGLLLVVETGNQRRDTLARALLQAERAGLTVIGAVVNKQRRYIPCLLDGNL